MKLEQSFTVAAPIEQVWDALVNVERIAPCLPGAEITGQGPDGSYEGNFTVKLGPTTASYRGSLKMDSLDEASHTATMHAKGTDKRGQGGANATIVSSLREDGGETTVDVATDFTITGRLARFGRGGMIEDISRRMMRDFSQCLQATLTSEPAPAAAEPAPAAAAEAPAAATEAPAAPAPVTPGEEAAAAVASAGGAAAEASAATESAPAPPAPKPAPPPPARPQAAKPVQGIRLVLSVLWERVVRFFARLLGRGEK
jgi:carbon monoxide dehydrogenase subunit G